MLLVANSTPMVDFDSRLNSLRVNLANKLLLPTPESPIRTTIIKKRNNISIYDLLIKQIRKLSKIIASNN